MSSKTARAASALKSGVVTGGTAILSAMNGITPHMAGAIDIMVVEQPDGTLKCSPFYVRFGKYTPMRSKDKAVKIIVNGEEASFGMHLGTYGQAYFAAETTEIVSDQEEQDLLAGMMSPPSGYSSPDESTPYANAEILSAVKQEVERLKQARSAAAADSSGAGASMAAGSAPNGESTAAELGSASLSRAAGAVDGGAEHSGGSSPRAEGDRRASEVQQRERTPSPPQQHGAGAPAPGTPPRPGPSRLSAASSASTSAAAAAGAASIGGVGRLLSLPPLPAAEESSSDLESPTAEDVAAAIAAGIEAAQQKSGQAGSESTNSGAQAAAAAAVPPSVGGQAADEAYPRGTIEKPTVQDLEHDPNHENRPFDQFLLDSQFTFRTESGTTSLSLTSDEKDRLLKTLDAQKAQKQKQHEREHQHEQQHDKQQQQAEMVPEHPGATQRQLQRQPPQQQLEEPQQQPMQQQPRAHQAAASGRPPLPPQQGAAAAAVAAAQQPESPFEAPDLQQQDSQGRPQQFRHLDRGPSAHSRGSVADSYSLYSSSDLGEVAGVRLTVVPSEQEGGVRLRVESVYDDEEEEGEEVTSPLRVQVQQPASSGPGTQQDERANREQADASGVQQVASVQEAAGAAAAAAAAELGAPGTRAAPAAVLDAASPSHAVNGAGSTPPAAAKADAVQDQLTAIQAAGDQAALVAHARPLAATDSSAASPSSIARGKEPVSPPARRSSLLTSSLRAGAADAAAAKAAANGMGAPRSASLESSGSTAANGRALDAATTARDTTAPDGVKVDAHGSMNGGMAWHAASVPAAVSAPSGLLGLSDSGATLAPPLTSTASADQAATTSSTAASGRSMPATMSSSIPVPVARPLDMTALAGGSARASPPTTSALGALAANEASTSAGNNAVLGSSLNEGYISDYERTPKAAGDASTRTSGAGALLPLPLQDLQLSDCGQLLRRDMSPAEARAVFEEHALTAAAWMERGGQLVGSPGLVVRIGGALYPWSMAQAMVVGALVFGVQQHRWEGLLMQDEGDGWWPLRVQERSSTQKKSAASSSWRLWPFSGWRDSSATKAGTAPKSPGPPASSPRAANGDARNLASVSSPPTFTAAAGDTGQAGEVVAASADSLSGGALAAASVQLATVSAPSPQRRSRKRHIIIIRKTLIPTSNQLASLRLKPGSNTIAFRVAGGAELRAYMYFYKWHTRLVISDVDGTITRSDLLGHVLPTLGVDWSHVGITQLFHNIVANGYHLLFLSSRAIAQANITREYLHALVQNGYKMPDGPVIISPHGLLPSLYREIVQRRPHEFKIACLQDIRALFPPDWNPFYAGYGNRDTDVVSYRQVGVPLSRIFTINPKGQIQKASSTVQSSTWSSLSAINDLVHEVFPPITPMTSASAAAAAASTPPAALSAVGLGAEGGGAAVAAAGTKAPEVVVQPERDEFNDVQYWRPAMVVDISEELQQLEAFKLGGGTSGVTVGVHEAMMVGGDAAGPGSGAGGAKGSGTAGRKPQPETEGALKTGHY